MREVIILSAVLVLGAVNASAQPAPATAPPAATPAMAPPLTVGATVFDPSGAQVGIIDSIAPDAVVVSTGTNKLAIPPGSFGTGPKGPLLSATKADLDAAAAKGAAEAKARLIASLTPGAEVRGATGQNVVGSVKALEGEFVIIATPEGSVKVPVSGLSIGPKGLVIGLTAAEFEAAVAASKPAA